MLNVSFTGLKNIGGCGYGYPSEEGSNFVIRDCMLLQLTDDCNGKDYTEFYDVIQKSSPEKWFYRFSDDPSRLHILTECTKDTEKEIEVLHPRLYINYHLVPTEKATLNLFSYIAKLTRRISNMKESEFICSNDFKYGLVGRLCLIPNFDLVQLAQNLRMNYKKFIDQMPFSSDFCVKTAQAINQNIKKQMINYLK